MNLLDEINESLNWVNNIKSTYDFVEWKSLNNKELITYTKNDLKEIIETCKEALYLINTIKER